MNDKSAGEKVKELGELEDDFIRLSENEMFYYDEINPWKKRERIFFILMLVSIALFIVPTYSLPEGVKLYESYPDYPLQTLSFFVGFGLFVTSIIGLETAENKISRIRNELGLHREERIYLRAYETSTTIDSYLSEPNLRRKSYFKRLALQNTQELVEIVGGWKYGNIRLIANLIGDKINLLKDNMGRLVLSNVAKGDDKTLKKISKTLLKLCEYIHSPSLDELDELNNMMKEIPFKEYKYLTRKEKMGAYFYSRPRIFRLIFASSITITVVTVLLCLEQNLGLAVGVGVTCFWGSFTGFDKLFGTRK